MNKAAVCTIGDELLIGQVTDTNSPYIAKELNRLGIKVDTMVSIADDTGAILACLKELTEKYRIVIVTGGLGPTRDDITKKALGILTGSGSTYIHQGQLSVIHELLASRGISLEGKNHDQASVPDTASVIVNRRGTAPCMVFDMHGASASILYSLPGVPYEVEGLMLDVSDDIVKRLRLGRICHETMLTFGIAESTLADMIEDWEQKLPEGFRLAYLPDPIKGVRLRLSVYDSDNYEDCMKKIRAEFSKLVPVLGNAIYGFGDETSLQTVIGHILSSNRKTLSVAESCTGGTVSSLITSVPGASGFFYGGVVSYHNKVKADTLNVPENIIARYGAVSRECAEAMALGVMKAIGTDYSVATTGIAGPDGGSADKPVGTVWIAVAFPDNGKTGIKSQCFRFNSDRTSNIRRFSATALNMLRLVLPAGQVQAL